MVGCRAVAILGGDATGQDALDGALNAAPALIAKFFHSPEGENMLLSCPLHDCLGVFGP